MAVSRRLLDADGTDTLDIDEFTSTMMRLMTDGPDEVTLERARRQALTKAFEEADTDKSGTLDAGEIMELLKSSDPLRTHSELDTQVGRTTNELNKGKRRSRVTLVALSQRRLAPKQRLHSSISFLVLFGQQDRARAWAGKLYVHIRQALRVHTRRISSVIESTNPRR